MRKVAWFGAIALGLLGSVHVQAETSPTREQSVDQAQQQSRPAQQQEPAQHNPANIIPPPPLTQPQAPIADQAAPAAVGPAQANTTSGPAGDGTPLGATAQTMPSTISKENAALDKLPTTALQFPLTDEQKQLIARSVAASPKAQSAELANVHTAMFLPLNTSIRPFSEEVTQKVPDAARYKYVKLDDRVLIVDPPLLTVVGEIKL
jgi:hypothetical protein